MAESIGFQMPKEHERDLARAFTAAVRATGAEDVLEVDVVKLAKQMAVMVSGAVVAPLERGSSFGCRLPTPGGGRSPLGRRPESARPRMKAARTVLQCVK
ncbi:MAG: hypothetical protein R3F14_46030 [Polyangiaceae bacterium]